MSIYDEYRKFWRRLSSEEKAVLAGTGFRVDDPNDAGVPLAHRYFGGEPTEIGDGGADNDSGYDIDHHQSRAWAHRQREESQVSERTFTQDEVFDILRKVISVIDLSPNAEVRLHGTCIKLALGMPDQPTMTALAEKHNLTRAAVSARVKTIQKNLGLPPSIYMKSEHACARLKRKK